MAFRAGGLAVRDTHTVKRSPAPRSTRRSPADNRDQALDARPLTQLRTTTRGLPHFAQKQRSSTGPSAAQSLMHCSTSTGVALVHAVAGERRIVRVDEHREVASVRQSPKRDTAVAVFDKLVAFPSLLTHPNFTIEVLVARGSRPRRPTAHLAPSDPGIQAGVGLSRCSTGSNFAAQMTSSKCSRPFRASRSARATCLRCSGCNMVLAHRTATAYA